MKKNKAITGLIVFVLVLIGLGYTAAFGIGADKSGSASGIKLGLDLAGGVSITYQVVGDELPDKEDMSDTIYKLQQRVENYSTEAQVYQEGDDRINIEIPGVSDANAILEELGQPGTLYFIAQTDSAGNQNYTSNYGIDADGNIAMVYELTKSLEELQADGSIVLTGTDVASAQAGSQQDQLMNNTQYVVQLTLTDAGTVAFAAAYRRIETGTAGTAFQCGRCTARLRCDQDQPDRGGRRFCPCRYLYDRSLLCARYCGQLIARFVYRADDHFVKCF